MQYDQVDQSNLPHKNVIHMKQRTGCIFLNFIMLHFNNVILRRPVWSRNDNKKCSPQEFSSEPSVQSFSPLQKSPLSIQALSPQAKYPSWHKGSSVKSRGFTLRSLFLILQFLTASFQSQVCLSMSKYKPAGQRMAWRPCTRRNTFWMVSGYKLNDFIIIRESTHWWCALDDISAVVAFASHQTEPFSSVFVLAQFSFEALLFFGGRLVGLPPPSFWW